MLLANSGFGCVIFACLHPLKAPYYYPAELIKRPHILPVLFRTAHVVGRIYLFVIFSTWMRMWTSMTGAMYFIYIHAQTAC